MEKAEYRIMARVKAQIDDLATDLGTNPQFKAGWEMLSMLSKGSAIEEIVERYAAGPSAKIYSQQEMRETLFRFATDLLRLQCEMLVTWNRIRKSTRRR